MPYLYPKEEERGNHNNNKPGEAGSHRPVATTAVQKIKSNLNNAIVHLHFTEVTY